MSRNWNFDRIEGMSLEKLQEAKRDFLARIPLFRPKYQKLILKDLHRIERELEKRQQAKD